MSSSITTPTQLGLAIILWGTNLFVWLSKGVNGADLSFACVFGATISLIVMVSFISTNLEQLGMVNRKTSKRAVSEFQKKLHEVEVAKQMAANRRNQSSTSAAENCLTQAGMHSPHKTA